MVPEEEWDRREIEKVLALLAHAAERGELAFLGG
jgi:hypothetical protein